MCSVCLHGTEGQSSCSCITLLMFLSPIYFEFLLQCMKRFMRETDPCKVRQKLLHALDECGRRDLREDVEEILNRRAY
jgi:hypothetical protein